MPIALVSLLLLFAWCGTASAWGPDGHSTVAEIAQVRLKPAVRDEINRILGGRSLASVASWADDYRDTHPETTNWHFANIPSSATAYDAVRDCAPGPEGDCIVAELDRLRQEIGCTGDETAERDALRFAVHFVGDAHQPLHVLADKQGGNLINVAMYVGGVACAGTCVTPVAPDNLHNVWDVTLIDKAVWDWGSMVDIVESGWLMSDAAKAPGIDGGTPSDWVNQTLAVAKDVWNMTPENFVIDDAYFDKALPIIEQQLGLAGIRLARLLNDAYISPDCRAR